MTTTMWLRSLRKAGRTNKYVRASAERWSSYGQQFFSTETQAGEKEYKIGVHSLISISKNPEQPQQEFLQSLHAMLINWTTAADKGHVKAQSALGKLYLTGLKPHLQPDPSISVKFMQQAAENQDTESLHTLGKMHFTGSHPDLVPEDISRALELWVQAAEKGHPISNYDLGHLYYFGLEKKQIKPDQAKGLAYLKEAVKLGDLPDAHRTLGQHYLGAKEEKKAVQHFQKAADQGHAASQFDLGACYLLGKGVEVNAPKAAEFLFMAAEVGNIPEAQVVLAQMFEKGQGIAQDREKAIEFYRKAHMNQVEAATNALHRLGVDPNAEPSQ